MDGQEGVGGKPEADYTFHQDRDSSAVLPCTV